MPNAECQMPNDNALARVAIFAGDIKVSHTVFALPWAMLAVAVAARQYPGALTIGKIALVLLCMVTARTVAMSANRLLDARLDAVNPRTQRRAIPSGTLSARFYCIAMLACAALFIAATARFWHYGNPWPLVFSVPVLAFVAAYPFTKRFTTLCHFYLGAALALAPVCAWMAIAGHLDLSPWLMAAAVLTWTAGFDIIYACQDYQSDIATGVFSVPASIGIGPALWVSRLTHLLSLSAIILVGKFAPGLGTLYFVGVGIAAVLLVIEHAVVKPRDLSKVNLAFFTINGIISIVLCGLGIIDTLISHLAASLK